jgi:hypothetical protein
MVDVAAKPEDAYTEVLTSVLRQPMFLTAEELEGGWRELFPDLAETLPKPYPIFSYDEEEIVARGFTVHLNQGMKRVRQEIEKQVTLETKFKCTTAAGGRADKSKVMAQRERYFRGMASLLENALLNDYRRGLVEILILFHSGEVARTVAKVPSLLMRGDSAIGLSHADSFRYSIATVFADLFQRAAQSVMEKAKSLKFTTVPPTLPPIISAICQEYLLFAETRPPVDIKQIREYLRLRFRSGSAEISAAHEGAALRLRALLKDRPQLRAALRMASRVDLDLNQPNTLLQSGLLDALREIGIAESLGLSSEQLTMLRELGLRLKRFELLATFRQVIFPIEGSVPNLVLTGRSPEVRIAAATRPYDFARPGVIDSAVRRFGLVYDLTNFTALLEGVRKKGPTAEEKALQFMYLFQRRLDEIRRRRRLVFEKFLGDGAFYSARRARRVLAAACEIHALYDDLRRHGFPFDQGMRIAINYGTYRLLPMLSQDQGGLRFEFFGHGIVELARLTTGKSTRELEEIAQFLIHSGYDPSQVDTFLEPLMQSRRGRKEKAQRPYAATIDEHGELVNEGIVLTLPFLEQLSDQIDQSLFMQVKAFGFQWLVFPLDPAKPKTLYTGLRYMGVARLKGLPPVELVEMYVWRKQPRNAKQVAEGVGIGLIDLLRRLGHKGGVEQPEEEQGSVPEDLVVATYLDDDDSRRWIFGEYRDGTEVLLHAFRVQMQLSDIKEEEPLENWLLRNRHKLAGRYEALRQEYTGQTMSLKQLKEQRDYTGCFLSAPHKAP